MNYLIRIIICLFFPLSLAAQSWFSEERDTVYGSPALPEDTTFLQEEIPDAVDEVLENMQEYTPPPVQPVELKDISKNDWDKAVEGLDYSKDTPNPPKKRKERQYDPSSGFNWGSFQGFGNVVQGVAAIFALCVIIYGIYWMMQTPRNRKLANDGTIITLANLDEYIHETDLDQYLREALSASNWPLAVRLYFLQTIKKLSERKAIEWAKDKTNRDYLKEMHAHALSTPFRDVTRRYERVWYGNQHLNREEFEQIEPEFKELLGKI